MNNSGKSFARFLLLWSGELISAVGSGLTAFGLAVYVFGLTRKASAVALVALLAFMPALLLSPLAGVLADRYERRLMMMLGDSLSAVGIAFILTCMLRGEAQLWQICTGVSVSSVFSSLLEPAYRATVTDLLTEEQYTKASGLVQIAGSAKYLVSPVIAGFLLTVSDIKLLLIIDICTFFVTVISTLAVRKGLASKKSNRTGSFILEFKTGWDALSQNRGVLILVIMTSVITFFLGFVQVLMTPMILAFSDSSVLGTVESVAASGMLVTSVVIGIIPIKRGFVKILSASLFCAGIFIAMFGVRENIVLICVSGFMFFAMLPFANTSLDYLARTNIRNSVQGRAWGLIGVISQLGFIAAYVLSGVLADSVGKLLGTGSGRGAGLLIVIAGVLLSLTSIALYKVKAVRRLESRGALCITK